jgi:hypothetical protein
LGATLEIFRNQFKDRGFHKLLWPFVGLALLTSCAKNLSFEALDAETSMISSGAAIPIPVGGGGGGGPSTAPGSSFKAEPLVWESSRHPERTAWSNQLAQIVATNFKELDRAQDIATFCPRYAFLNGGQKVNVWSNLFAATSYYESGWKPTASSVDVGTPFDENTWSVGLLQLSVVDQANYGLNFGFTFADLQNPVKNLQLGVKIMAKQISKHGRILIPAGGTGLYWATLHPGGKYDASKDIEKATSRLSFCN